MIEIIRVVGEGVDLRTHRQSPKAIVLSNGVIERIVPVDDAVVAAIFELMADGTNGARPKTGAPNGARQPTPEGRGADSHESLEPPPHEIPEGEEEEYSDPISGATSL